MSDLIDEFNKVKSDRNKFTWLMSNQNKGLQLTLDNDDMFIVDLNEEDSELGRFESWIGNAPGIMDLLLAVGIDADYC